MPKPFRTTVIGSYFRRDSQALRRPTLTREEANAHVRWAIDEQVRAGMEIIADGEQRRESFITFVQRRMAGFDFIWGCPSASTCASATRIGSASGTTGGTTICWEGDVLTIFDTWNYKGEVALGVVDVKSETIETPQEVADRMRPALKRFGKMAALAGAAAVLRSGG